MKKWYLKGKQKNYGPYSSEQIIDLLTKKKIKLTTLISKDTDKWKSAESRGFKAKNSTEFIYERPKRTQKKKPSTDINELKLEQSNKSINHNQSSKPENTSATLMQKEPNNLSQNINAEQPSNQHHSPQTNESNDSPVMHNDYYMIALALLPLLIAGGLILGMPKSVLGIIFSIIAAGLVYIDREALKKFHLDPPHWVFAFLPPLYLKQREKVQENPYFFTLSSIASFALTAVFLMYGGNETYIRGTDSESYESSSYTVSDGLEGVTEDIPLPENGDVTGRMEFTYILNGRRYEGYRWIIKTDDSLEEVESYYDSIIPNVQKEMSSDGPTFNYKRSKSLWIRIQIDMYNKYIAIDELYHKPE